MSNSVSERWEEVWSAGDSVGYQIELLDAFVRDFPGSHVAWAVLGDRLSGVSRFAEAEQAFRHARELCPRDYHARLFSLLGQHFGDRGHFVKAERWFRKSIAEAPADTEGYIYLGCMFARLGRLADAERLHRQATACTTGVFDEAYHNLGLVLRAQRRYPEAVECFELARRIDPDYAEAREASREVVNAMRVQNVRSE
jgi:tetratricopeptide (TPR) repeat protein